MSILIRRVLSIPQGIKKNSQYESNDTPYYSFFHNQNLRKYCQVQHNCLKIEKKHFSKKRQAIKTISFTISNVECKLKEIMGKIRKLNLYKIILQQVLTFAFRVKFYVLFLKTSNQPLMFLRKLTQRHIYDLRDILDGPQVT